MKKFNLLMAIVLIGFSSSAQTDSTIVVDSTKILAKNDTIRIGNILIIKRGNKNSSGQEGEANTSIETTKFD